MAKKQLTKSLNADPFLRWAGGKSWLLKSINEYLPKTFNNYHEPFLGGGAMFFHLAPPNTSYLSDLNADLINTYIQIRDNVEDVINGLRQYKNTESHYYTIRNVEPKNKLKSAIRFIYLNKTSFNGIYRVNSTGRYNVPFGFRKTVDIVNEQNLRVVSLQLKNAILEATDFETSLAKVKKGDLVFLDPPYTVAHENNGFISYNQKIFSLEDQLRLSKQIEKIDAIGAYYILTNAKHTRIEKIYMNLNKPKVMYRSSTIGGEGAHRGQIKEFLYCNT